MCTPCAIVLGTHGLLELSKCEWTSCECLKLVWNNSREGERNGQPIGYRAVLQSNSSDLLLEIGVNGSVKYFAEEKLTLIDFNVFQCGSELHTVSLVGVMLAGEGQSREPCQFNVSCYNNKKEDSTSGLSSGIW